MKEIIRRLPMYLLNYFPADAPTLKCAVGCKTRVEIKSVSKNFFYIKNVCLKQKSLRFSEISPHLRVAGKFFLFCNRLCVTMLQIKILIYIYSGHTMFFSKLLNYWFSCPKLNHGKMLKYFFRTSRQNLGF